MTPAHRVRVCARAWILQSCPCEVEFAPHSRQSSGASISSVACTCKCP